MSDDPLRGLHDAPPGVAALVRSLERPPPLPPDIRALVRASIARRAATTPRATRWIAPGVLAVAAVIAGIVVWVVKHRAPEADHEELVSVVETPDAGIMGVFAPAPLPGVGPDAGAADMDLDAAAHEAADAVRQLLPFGPRRRDGGADAGRTVVPPVPARLFINSVPWSRVFFDGENRGWITPVVNVDVPAGRHTLTFVTSDGASIDQQVELPAGETTRILRQLGPAPAPPADTGSLTRARACAIRGDTACVIRETRGGRSQPEMDMLIQAYRDAGRQDDALPVMRRYVDLFPTSLRARAYRALLAREDQRTDRGEGVDPDNPF